MRLQRRLARDRYSGKSDRGQPAAVLRCRIGHPLDVAPLVDPERVELGTLAALAPVDGLRVLELGCGQGRVTAQIAEVAASVLAVDPDKERVAVARAAIPASLRKKVTFEVASAAEVDAPKHPFDLAIFSWSL
jgi:2-polyprenyl-3-methyl-5-hydroxy-6-metoxy-1,4-benzoquinol methylase